MLVKNFNYSKLDNAINLSISLDLEDKLNICFSDLPNLAVKPLALAMGI